MEVRIYYEDTDCGGVVYYANYLRFLERARTEFLRERGIELAELAKRGILFAVVSVQLNYRLPALYNGLLSIDLWVSSISRASFCFSHKIRRKGETGVLCDGEIALACVDSQFKPRGIPEEVRTLVVRPC